MRGTWIVAFVCGCSFHQGTATTGAPDVDAPTVSDPGADSDGDGILDGVDNCPFVANHDQRDFDGDLRGDACDVCPHIVETGADFDHDGVGDACDPRPMDPGDRIAFFDGFYSMNTWTAVEGPPTWKIDNGKLHQPNAAGIYQLVRPANPAPNNVFVETRVHANALDQGSQRQAVGLVVGYQSTSDYYFCGVASAYGTSEIEAGRVDPPDGYYNYNPGAFDAPMTGDAIVLQARTSEPPGGYTHLDCNGAVAMTQGNAGYDSSTLAAGEISLRTNGVDASFDYVFVVEVPPPSP